MRAKIILPNFAAVLAVGLASYFYLTNRFEKKAREARAAELRVISGLFARSEGLRGFELLNSVRAQAMSRNMVDVFEKLDIEPAEGQSREAFEISAREIWFKKCVKAINAYSALWQKRYGKRPELVLVTDRRGVAIARNTTPNACPVNTNVADGMPVVARALDGEASYGVWSIDKSPFSKKKNDPKYCQLMNTDLLEIAASPIWHGDDIAGALVVGLDISDGTAKKHAELTDMSVAVLKGDSVYSASLGTDTARQSLEQQLARSKIREQLDFSIEHGRLSEVFAIEIEGVPYIAQSIPMTNADPRDRIATLILASFENAAADVESLRFILVVTAVGLLLVFIVGMVLTHHFLRPVMDIEEGILKVINGEYDYRFDVKSSEVGGLSYRINQMIGVLTEEDEEVNEVGDDAEP